ncbi:hypothetical protein MR730_09095 [bacterium]|nr:hypothetical protein [bacterium]
MCDAPFCALFTFKILDGDADLPQHLLIDLADRRAQRPDGSRGVEVEDRHEVLMAEILLRLQPAAGHEGVGDANGGGGFELDFDVVLIVLLQKGTVNDRENVLPVFRPVFLRQLGGHIGQMLGQVAAANIVVALQHRHDRRGVFLAHLPQPGRAGVFTGASIGNIEHIAQPGPVAGIIHQGDAFGAAPHIPVHFFIPQVVLGAGGGVRALSVDHHLFMERILVKTGGGSKKARPLLPAAGELDRHLLRHLRILFCFGWHGILSSFHLGYRKTGNLKRFPVSWYWP